MDYSRILEGDPSAKYTVHIVPTKNGSISRLFEFDS